MMFWLILLVCWVRVILENILQAMWVVYGYFLKQFLVIAAVSWSMFHSLYLCIEWGVELWIGEVFGEIVWQLVDYLEIVLYYFILHFFYKFGFKTMVLLWCPCWANWESSVKYSKTRLTWRKWRHRGFRVYNDLADSVKGRDFSIK